MTRSFADDTQDYICSITPTEFEVFCMDLLQNYADAEGLTDFTIEHNVKMKAYDGTYQIDVYASFTAMGMNFKVLCECKQYKNKVKRETIQILANKLESLGVHKGIFLSTSGFQKGAVEYAKAHGIALIQVFDHSCIAVSHSSGIDTDVDENDPMIFCEKLWPKYRALCFSPDSKEPKVIYPTKKIVSKIYKEMTRLMKENYGIETPLV